MSPPGAVTATMIVRSIAGRWRGGVGTAGLVLMLSACSGVRPDSLGLTQGRLAACPPSPNCVSSEAEDADHRVEPFVLAVDARRARALAEEAVRELPRTTIVTAGPDYIHAECRSLLFRYVDDLELHVRPEAGVVAVRSASRLGHSDLGVNRRRVDRLRASLRERGAIR